MEGVVGRQGEEEQGAEYEGVGLLTAKRAKDAKVFSHGSHGYFDTAQYKQKNKSVSKRGCDCFWSQPLFFDSYNDHTMTNIVGKYIKQIREEQGLTQEQLAIRIEMAGWQVDRFIVSKIERGDRQVSDVEAQLIAKALKVSAGRLFGEE